ncbi:MAG: DUF4129 domain-containing protein, partial [Dehalococcoidia bacterium]|nr:DUF4129 domain-containing protein [Dehalococcoidia bacterium]
YSILEGESRKLIISLYRLMEKVLEKKGLPVRQAHQSPAEYLKMITTRILNGEKLIEWVTVQTTRAAYNPDPFDSSKVDEAKNKLSLLKKALKVGIGSPE